jgi:hypothetical protein
MVIANLEQLEFGDFIRLVKDTDGTFVNCIIGRQIGSRESDEESNEKLIISLDFTEAMRVSMAIKLGMKFYRGHTN